MHLIALILCFLLLLLLFVAVFNLYIFKTPEHAVQCSRLDFQYLNLRKNLINVPIFFAMIDDFILRSNVYKENYI